MGLKDLNTILLLSSKLALLLVESVDKKYIKKQILLLIKEIILYTIQSKLMAEFKKRGLEAVYKEEIEAWFIYLDQQKFGKELEIKMLKEIDRFMAEKKTIGEIMEETFKKPEWEIEFIEGIPANYVFKSALGYS